MINRRNGQNGAKRNGNLQQAITLAPRDGLEQVQEGEMVQATSGKLINAEPFDQPVVLQQTSIWSRAILWGIVGFATFGIAWAAIAKIEEAVPATGQLQPQDQVQPIQAPVGGVVQTIHVQDGQRVKKGDLLIRFDPTAAEAQSRSLNEIRTSLERQNQFLRSQLSGAGSSGTAQPSQLGLPPEVLSLTANRATLLSEIQLYQAQLTGSASSAGLTAEQLIRIQAGLSEARSREAAAQLEVSQLQEQLSQVQTRLGTARESLAIDEQVLADFTGLFEEGGIQRLQVTRQEQQVIESRSEIEQLEQEEQRLLYSIAQAQERLQNTVSVTRNDLLEKIATNQEQIATIDSQLNQKILDNESRLSEVNSQLSQADLNLRYQELRAPIDGVVFDIQAKGPGFVANTTEPILKVVPDNALIAEVFVTNQDIGFIDEGMPVDIRIDTFPFSEFGDIKGTIANIGSDALPPDQVHNFYRFPVRVEMDSQFLETQGREIPLQSGMSITANIITRDRTVLSIFTDQFTRQVDNLKTVR